MFIQNPVNTLLEALESTSELLQKDGPGVSSPKNKDTPGLEGRGITFLLCDNKGVQRELETLKVVQYNESILVGTPTAIEEAAKLRKLSSSSSSSPLNVSIWVYDVGLLMKNTESSCEKNNKR